MKQDCNGNEAARVDLRDISFTGLDIWFAVPDMKILVGS
jgi:hypothetical protein